MSTEPAPPPGYAPFNRHGAFAGRIGPFYLRPDGDACRYAFRLDRRHANPNGIAHGGALYTFADHFLGHAIVHRLKRMCATVKLKVEYLAAARPGRLVEGACDIVRATRTMAFVRARVTSDGHVLMTADGAFKLLGAIEPGRLAIADDASVEVPVTTAPAPAGFKAFNLQGNFAEYYGPMHYRRDDDGSFVCGIHTTPAFDNSTGATHGGALFSFADDMMGRAVSGTARRYSATVALDAQYLAPAPLDAWLEGRAVISRIADSLAFVRGEVSHAGRPILLTDGVWRLFAGYDRDTAKPATTKTTASED